jgi:hypothetical protein
MLVGPGVVIKTKDQLGESPVLVLQHLATMPCLVVEFAAPWDGFTIVNCG